MSIGETLAAAREEAGLTVARVSQTTCIRETIVAAIENDDFELCGGHFYARGHIRSIAAHIGIDPEPLIQQYDEEHGGSPRVANPAQTLDGTPVSVPAARRSPNWSMALVALLVVVIAYGAYTLFSGPAGQGKPQEEPGPIVQATHSTPPPDGTSSSHSPEAAGSQPKSKAPAARPDRAAIRLQARERTWISVSGSNGQDLFRGTMYKGDSKRFTDHELIRIVIGNMGGVSLTINGKKLGVVGEPGQVVEGLRVYPDRIVGLSQG